MTTMSDVPADAWDGRGNGAGPPSGFPQGNRSGKVPARSARLPTIWVGPHVCGLPPSGPCYGRTRTWSADSSHDRLPTGILAMKIGSGVGIWPDDFVDGLGVAAPGTAIRPGPRRLP
jgi:hypothetical protein